MRGEGVAVTCLQALKFPLERQPPYPQAWPPLPLVYNQGSKPKKHSIQLPGQQA